MDFKTQIKFLSFINKCMSLRTTPIYSNQFTSQLRDFNQYLNDVQLLRVRPESVGVDSKYLIQLYDRFLTLNKVNPHGIVIIKDGKVIFDVSFKPFNNQFMHATHSLLKSITTLAILFAKEEGLINFEDSITKFFKEELNKFNEIKLKKITVYHLLTMSSGIEYNEINSILENDWVKGYLESNIKFKPGSHFQYNSLNSYILSVIISKVTHQSLEEYLTPRLFQPLGINQHFFEKCPKGYCKGGWGGYLSLESMAKIGLLYLQKGMYNGVQLISKKLIEEATSLHIHTSDELNLYGYGYQLWMSKRPNCYQLNGMLGQNVIINHDLNMVVAITAGSTSVFSNSPEVELINNFFSNFYTLKLNKSINFNYLRLKHRLNNTKFTSFKKSKDINLIKHYCYKVIALEPNIASIMPLFIQGITNNHTLGIQSIRLEIDNDKLIVNISENDQHYRFETSNIHTHYTSACFNGDIYTIATCYELTENEDHDLVLKLEFDFVETANSRIIKIVFKEEDIQIKFNEIPCLMDLLNTESNSVLAFGKNKFNLEQHKLIAYRIENWLKPKVKAYVMTK